MPDVSHYTASPADRDIIFIQPEVPFMLIGATERRRWGGYQRWDDGRRKEGSSWRTLASVGERGMWRRAGMEEGGGAEEKWRCSFLTFLTSPLLIFSLLFSFSFDLYLNVPGFPPSVKALLLNSAESHDLCSSISTLGMSLLPALCVLLSAAHPLCSSRGVSWNQ